MGTPDFARIQLEALIDSGADIIGVVTQPDKPKGRKLILTPPPVKECAIKNNIPVYQPNSLRGEEFAQLLSGLAPELIIVAAYGKILPENVINFAKYGCINVHGSLLPEYRGAAPIQRAIIDGKSETGITIMYMDISLDTGDMLSKVVVPIEKSDNFETMHDKLAEAGAKLLIETIEQIENGTAKREKQDDSKSTYAKKIENEDCLLDFSLNAEDVYNRIRGLSPFPLAVCSQEGKALKIDTAELLDTKTVHDNYGEVISVNQKAGYFEIACRKGSIAVRKLLPEGKGRMSASDYINGRKISVGDKLTTYKK